LKLKGKLDQLEQYPDRIIPLEFKTGSCPQRGVWPGHQLQMGAYLMLLRQEHPNISEGIVRYLDAREDRSVMLNQFLEEKILRIRDDIINLLGSKELPDFVDNRNKCKSCQLKEKCHDEKFLRDRMKELN
jgi:CRISPR/Cas system-associated exonuclease Cas4 (RecB family)